ncbi:fibulin-1 isoform X4 [Astyanax mexicanus]|uniref:fibulin-1 isoform X4 n=1 Tax=Astyanax mexicanus TaxID=7994 RepID=UPI0020CB3DAB|nr:fibulin-1 isoform X4 [Astyanax mexicanus]
MGPTLVILFLSSTLYGFVHSQETTDPISLDDCCKDGKEKGLQSQDCTRLPLISESTTCRIAQEQCCAAVLEDNSCTNGINMAKDQGTCDALLSGSTCETKTAKVCCECCLLGRAAEEQGLSCDFSLTVSYQCGLVSRACCVDKSPETDGNSTQGAAVPDVECKVGAGNCAQRCVGNNTCACFAGYKLKPDGKNCEDINECLLGSHHCRPGERCINTMGSYRCQREVSCGTGYELTDSNSCKDIDECAGSDNACAGHGCINLVGSYRCECRSGFTFNSITRVCEDINECRHFPGRLCAHKCDNVLGSYKCSCTTGFKLASDGRNCDDLNECESSPCSQECANVYGSYQCYCRRGYQLSDVDGITCEDIDECALPTGGHICSYRCHNTPGSFHCTCPAKGYTLAPNGRSCQDVDECVTGTHTCSETESCFNIQGGFRCLNFDCPPNYRRSSETRARVDRSDTIRCIKSCQPNDITCVLDPVHSVSHTVISLPTFREFNKPEEIVFLRSVTPSHYPHMDSPELIYDIQEGNIHNSFDIIKRVEHGMIVGVVRQVKPLVGPASTVLKLAMNYVMNGVVSHRNIINVHVFVSEFWF